MLTNNYDVALQWAKELYGSPNFMDFWFPRHHFIEAERGESWMTASRADKDKCYAMAIGAESRVNMNLNHFSISRFADLNQIDLEHFKFDDGWVAYVIETAKYSQLAPLEKIDSPHLWDEINNFLDVNFTDASTRAGNPEVLAWTILRDDRDGIIAVGALSQWESGNLAANSIGVASSLRGQGIGKLFVERMIATAYSMGFDSLCLGVYDNNIAGIRLYESIGFTKVEEFFHYSEKDDLQKRRNRPVKD